MWWSCPATAEQRRPVVRWAHARGHTLPNLLRTLPPCLRTCGLVPSVWCEFPWTIPPGWEELPADIPAVQYYVMGATDDKDAPGNEWRTVTAKKARGAWKQRTSKSSTASPRSGSKPAPQAAHGAVGGDQATPPRLHAGLVQR